MTEWVHPARLGLARFRADHSGVALLEFALSLPLVMAAGLYAIEVSNLALANLRVSQAALNLADNASRVGVQNSLSVQQLREVDINDVLDGTRQQGAAWGLTTRGRITLSSLEEHGGKQMIHWQRCMGMNALPDYASHYGTTSTTAGTDSTVATAGTEAVGGMGITGAKVQSPPSSGVMFVEINYDYNPVVGTRWLPGGPQRIHYVASFIVRDRRDFAQLYNLSPSATRSTCDRHAA